MRTVYLLATSVLLLALPAFSKHEPKHYEQGMLIDVQDQRVNGPLLLTGNLAIPTKRTLYHITIRLSDILRSQVAKGVGLPTGARPKWPQEGGE